MAACRQKRRVRFATAAALVNELVEAKHQLQLGRALARWARYDLIALDEVGYIPLAEVGAEFLFQVIAERAEKAAVIVTTNLPFSEWTQVIPSLREGMEELFTINRLGLSPSLCRALGSTNIIENPNSTARRKTERVTRWRDGEMVKRWVAAAFLAAEKSFRRILGFRDLWMLKAVLNEHQVAIAEQAA